MTDILKYLQNYCNNTTQHMANIPAARSGAVIQLLDVHACHVSVRTYSYIYITVTYSCSEIKDSIIDS